MVLQIVWLTQLLKHEIHNQPVITNKSDNTITHVHKKALRPTESQPKKIKSKNKKKVGATKCNTA